jgi:hypothetical protein
MTSHDNQSYEAREFGHDGEIREVAQISSLTRARLHARARSADVDVAFVTLALPERTDIFCRGRNRLRIRRPGAPIGVLTTAPGEFMHVGGRTELGDRGELIRPAIGTPYEVA